MTTSRPFSCLDLFRYNMVNLDCYTETYDLRFYFQHMCGHPEYCEVLENANFSVIAYRLFDFFILKSF
jgi:N-terminal acetyltransferase B complex catalytic subunit